MKTESINTIYTLGPSGTNCEMAAHEYFKRNSVKDGNVHLFSTLEEAMANLPNKNCSALLGCVVYPDLHNIVFQNLSSMEMVDSFIHPTYNMVLASVNGKEPVSVTTHPAPRSLLDSRDVTITLANSNVAAAKQCFTGATDGCITTRVSAMEHGLKIVEDFGPVPMGFTIHKKKSA